jgi:segregation and condensation protein B
MEAGMELESNVTDELNDAPANGAVAADNIDRLGSILESVLFAANSPMTVKELVDILKGPRGSGPKPKEIEQALTKLLDDYAPGRRGIQLIEVSGGYQFRTARENAEWVRAVFRDKPARLGRATLETLAIVAYKQPATRADVEAVRGVDADAAISTLMERRLIKIVGRKETVGRPLLYATTPEFLEAFGLNDLKDLPSLKELGPVPDAQENDTDPTATASGGEETFHADEGSPATAGAGDDTAIAETAQPGRHQLAPQGGGDDPGGPSAGEREGRDGTGDESGSPGRQNQG